MTSTHRKGDLFVEGLAFDTTGGGRRRHDCLIQGCPAALHGRCCQHTGLLHDSLVWGSHQRDRVLFSNWGCHGLIFSFPLVSAPVCDLLSSLPVTLTNNISVLTHDLLSRHLCVLQIFEELIQTVCLAALSPLPQLIWHQRRQAACEHLTERFNSWTKRGVCFLFKLYL